MREARVLGRTGMRISPVCLGAMMLGTWGTSDEAEAVRIIDRALDAGINCIDTADMYGDGTSEILVGKALAGGKRDNIVLASKLHFPMGEDANRRGNSRRWIVKAVEESLKRLNTDWIDLYQVHRPEPSCDIEETLGALTDLVHSGKVRYLGCSTFPPEEIVEAQWASARRGFERFVCEQPPYSILVRGIEADVLPVCERYGMGAITWSPLGAGWLSGDYRKGKDLPVSQRDGLVPQLFDLTSRKNQAKLEAVEQLALLAEKAGVTLIELSMGFALNHPAVTSVIVGPRTMEHLDMYLAAVSIELGTDLLDQIDEIVPPGTTLNQADVGWTPPSLLDTNARRRQQSK